MIQNEKRKKTNIASDNGTKSMTKKNITGQRKNNIIS